MNKNFNNVSNARYFDYRIDTRKALPISALKLDYDLKVGGYTFLPNTPFKTVLNRINDELNTMSSGSGIYGGSGDIPASTVATVSGNYFTLDYSTGQDAISISNTSSKLTASAPDGLTKLTLESGQWTLATDDFLLSAADAGSMTMTDGSATPKGIVYAGDYSANYTNRSLVDKAYVDGKTTSGTYTPSWSGVSNIDSASISTSACQYMKVGNTVTVSGRVSIATTSTGASVCTMSLPVASNFANDFECAGVGINSVQDKTVTIAADTTADRASFSWSSTNTSDNRIYFTYTYKVI